MKKLINILFFFCMANWTGPLWGIDNIVLTPPITLTVQTPDLNGAYKSKIVRTSSGVLVVIYGDTIEDNPDNYVFDSKSSSERPARDVFVTTCDSSSTDCINISDWSTPINISGTALLASMQTDWRGDGNRTPYHGDSDNPHAFASGDHVVVTWADKYCPGGHQRSVTYLEFGNREIAMSCVYAAHSSNNYDDPGSWTVNRLSDGSRDVKQDTTKGLSSGAWAITWQEDPLGLQPGEAEGPGEGSSGAKTSHGTDIWYSFSTNVAGPDADVGVWSSPVRITDNHTGYGVSGSFNPVRDSSGNTVDPGQIDKGTTGASRANLMVVGGSSPPNAVVAYEESKGSSGLAEGKFLRYHVFPYNAPPVTLSEKTGCIVSDPAENARRARFVTQTNAASGSGIRMALFWRQGLYSQGGPADIMMRLGYKTDAAGSTGLNPADLDPPVDSACNAPDYASAITINNTAPLNISSNTPDATDTNLADSSDADFLENSRAHRAVLRANDLYVGWIYTSDGVVADATDLANYNFFLRHFNAMTGSWGMPVNLSNIADTGINVLEPRLLGTPGNGPGCTDPGNITNFEQCQNKSVLIAAWGTETNVYQHIGGSENLDVFITRTTDKSANWSPVVSLASGPNSQGESQLRVTPDGNRIFAVWNETDNGAVNGMFSTGVPITLHSDMALSVISIPMEVQAGESIDIIYNVDNLGPDEAYNIGLVVNLPASVDYLSGSNICSYVTGTVTCALGNIQAGTGTPVNISVQTSIAEPLAFIASVESAVLDDPDMSNNQIRSVVASGIATPAVDIAVQASADPARPKAGKDTIVRIEISNLGMQAASDVVLTFSAPVTWSQRSLNISQGSCRLADNTFVCEIGHLKAGDSSTVAITGTVDRDGVVLFHASGSAAEFDSDAQNNDTDLEINFVRDSSSDVNVFGCSASSHPGSGPHDPSLLIIMLISLGMVMKQQARRA